MIGEWGNLQKSIQEVCLVLSYIFNTLLIYLILQKSPKSFGCYRVLMIYIAVTEILWSYSQCFVSPTYHSFGSSYSAFINIHESLIKDKKLLRILIDIWCGMYGTFMGMFALHYIYRYFVLMNNTTMLNTFKSWKILIWMSLPIIYGIVWGVVCYIFCAPNPEFTEYLRQSYHETYGYNMEAVVYIGVHFYPTDENGKQFVSWNAVIGVVIIFTMTMTSLVMILHFGVFCYLQIRKNFKTGSRQNNKLQQQVFVSLVIQTIIPILLMHTPVLIVFLVTFLDVSVGKLSYLVIIAIYIFSAIDPLPTMLIISDYRKAIVNFFQCCISVDVQNQDSADIELEIRQIN